MIGQSRLQSELFNYVTNGTFPRFTILVGPRGSGKRTLAKEIVKVFILHTDNSTHGIVCQDVKVDTVREIISQAYKTASTTIYIIPDADNMSVAAKNALLKVTEEPPNNAYFIMTLEDENNTLETIRSRGTVFHMDEYVPHEILEYARQYTEYTLHDDEWDIIEAICDTPGDVNILGKYPREFYDYVKLVVDNLADVQLANAFKVPSKVALKDTDDGYDLRLFWKAFIEICWDMAGTVEDDSVAKYCKEISITSKYLQQLKTKGINRQMLMDTWLMEIRDINDSTR